jgi:hypothetical protein
MEPSSIPIMALLVVGAMLLLATIDRKTALRQQILHLIHELGGYTRPCQFEAIISRLTTESVDPHITVDDCARVLYQLERSGLITSDGIVPGTDPQLAVSREGTSYLLTPLGEQRVQEVISR